MELHFYSTAFCEPCMHTRVVLAEVTRLVPAVTVREFDVASSNARAEAADVRAVPTVVLVGDDEVELFRASGEPSLNQVLVAIAKAI